MRMFLGALCVAFACSACATAQDPTKLAFPDNTKEALVLIKVDPSNVPYALHIASYDEANEAIGTVFSGLHILKPSVSPLPQYLAMTIDPGVYAFSYMEQQNHWAVCFSEKTQSFAVKPGEAVFLGEFNPRPNLAQLQELVFGSGASLASQYAHYFYFDGVLPPQITNPAEHSADFLQAKTYEAVSMPMLHGRLQPVTYKPATFRNGKTLDHTERRCGGFYLDQADSAK